MSPPEKQRKKSQFQLIYIGESAHAAVCSNHARTPQTRHFSSTVPDQFSIDFRMTRPHLPPANYRVSSSPSDVFFFFVFFIISSNKIRKPVYNKIIVYINEQ